MLELGELHKNKSSSEIQEIVCDYETPEDMLFQNLFVDRNDKMGIMFIYIDVVFRLQGFSEDNVPAYVMDELNMLKALLVQNKTFSSKHTESNHRTFKALPFSGFCCSADA